jgi:hypothetical protein
MMLGMDVVTSGRYVCMRRLNLHQVPIWRMLYAGDVGDPGTCALDWQRLATYVEQRRRGRLFHTDPQAL